MACEIIAEIGINHCGDMWMAMNMINLAKECGADTVKFQIYDPEKLLDPKDFSGQDWQAILKSKLNFYQVVELWDYCKEVGIEFLASAFDHDGLRWLETIGVKRHKIASRSIYDKAYVEKVKITGKPYIVSLGWLDKRDIKIETEKQLLIRLGLFESEERVKFLRCSSKYPTPLRESLVFNSMFSNPMFRTPYDGYSDHTIGLTASKCAIAYGAEIIEKHFTLDKESIGPDHKCSMDVKELKELCTFRDEYEEMING